MRSPKQIEASRINGRLSQGPLTPEGKHNSSRNNTRHGLLAQTVVLERESEAGFLELLDDFMQTHQPRSITEAALVEIMVMAQWRMLRVVGLQKLALDKDIALQDPSTGPASVRAMNALRGTPDNPSKPDVLQRYETTFVRQFKSALARLLDLQKRSKPPSAPYFPTHASGHNWKTEDEVDPREKCEDQQAASDPQNHQKKVPHAIRPQEVAETTISQKSEPNPKTGPTVGAKRLSRADPSLPSRRPSP